MCWAWVSRRSVELLREPRNLGRLYLGTYRDRLGCFCTRCFFLWAHSPWDTLLEACVGIIVASLCLHFHGPIQLIVQHMVDFALHTNFYEIRQSMVFTITAVQVGYVVLYLLHICPLPACKWDQFPLNAR